MAVVPLLGIWLKVGGGSYIITGDVFQQLVVAPDMPQFHYPSQPMLYVVESVELELSLTNGNLDSSTTQPTPDPFTCPIKLLKGEFTFSPGFLLLLFLIILLSWGCCLFLFAGGGGGAVNKKSLPCESQL